MNDIFVSYSRKDQQVVNKFKERLLSEGFTVWIDTSEIDAGDKYKSEITSAIRNSQVVLFFSSKNSHSSYSVKKEIGIAAHLKTRVLPIKLDDSSYPDNILYDLVDVDYEQCDPKNYNSLKQCQDKLIRTLRTIIERSESDEYLYCPRCNSSALFVKAQNVHLEEIRQTVNAEIDRLANQEVEEKDTSLNTLSSVSSAAIGSAAIGSVFGPIGAVVAASIGGLGALGANYYSSSKKGEKLSKEGNNNTVMQVLEEKDQPQFCFECSKCGRIFSMNDIGIKNKK